MLSLALVMSMLLTSACTLRPRYMEVLGRAGTLTGSSVKIRVVDGSGNPVSGARIEMGERRRTKVTTGADGIFEMPLLVEYREENPMVVVVLPQGIKTYRLEPVTETEAPSVESHG